MTAAEPTASAKTNGDSTAASIVKWNPKSEDTTKWGPTDGAAYLNDDPTVPSKPRGILQRRLGRRGRPRRRLRTRGMLQRRLRRIGSLLDKLRRRGAYDGYDQSG